jgi:hypothetical protein
MFSTMLACGPYFDENAVAISIFLFLFAKPLAYFCFIQAFRFRVNRPVPMRTSQAFKLTAARAGLGIGLTAAALAVLAASQSAALWSGSWLFLYVERVFSWWIVGQVGAGLAGRRLVGWVIFGTLINAAFDFAMVVGWTSGWGLLPRFGLPENVWPPVLIVTALIGAFIAVLHVVGRRDSLKRQFDSHARCVMCGYDLTGNLSGRCPECGHVLHTAPA